jgi:tRNA(Arg) A34 adenosine deaminase TadA
LKWTELSPAWQACLEEAWTAHCTGSVPVGAAVVDGDGKIISRGRNRIRELEAPPGLAYDNQLAHAELNALLALRRDSVNVHSCAIYTSLEPCPLCMGAIYMSGVRKIYYAAEDAYAGSTNLLGKTWYLARKPIQVSGPQRGGLAEFACALHIEFCLRAYPLPNPVVEMERNVFPAGVALAEKVRAGGLFQQWAAAGLETASVFDTFQDFFSDR